MSSILYLTSGISGSGKSKFTQFIKDILQAEEVNADNIRASLGDINNQSNNKEVFKILDNEVIKFLAGGINVIISNTNLHYFSIMDYANKFPYNKVVVFVMEDSNNPELCKKRIEDDLNNGKNRSKVPSEDVDRQFMSFSYLLKNIMTKKHPDNLLFLLVKNNFEICRMENLEK